MRRATPWGIPERLLGPGKTVTDPVHGDIHLTKLESAVVDSIPFQRLRRVKQLGNTHLVYPGATHSRFSHALGALRVAQDLLDSALDHRLVTGACPDLFGQWERELSVATQPENQQQLDRKVAEAVVLARLGALTHDLCHVPFGHSVEDELRLLTAHDENAVRFDRLWDEMPDGVATTVSGELLANLRPLILSKEKTDEGKGAPPGAYPFVADIVGNTICADLLDYLRRDHLYTGLPLALGRRFEAGFYVLPDGDPQFSSRLVLRIVRDGRERTDMITEILKHLRYRYELSERVLTHHAKLAADAMVGKALVMWHDALLVEIGTDRLTQRGADEPDWPAGREPDAVMTALGTTDAEAPDEVRDAVSEEMDHQLLRRGDDGLLEYLRDLPDARVLGASRDARRRRAISTLATDLLNRQLFKRIARQRHIRESREEFCEKFSTPEVRRRLEQQAARFAGVEAGWHIAVWVPPADMRLKVADVLVDDGRETRKFVEREGELYKRGAEIPKLHEQLWAVSVYAHDSVSDVRRERLLVSLSADLDIALIDRDVALHPEVVVHPPYEWPDRLAILPLQSAHGLDDSQVVDLIALRRVRAARGEVEGRPECEALTAEYAQLLPGIGLD